MVALNIRVKNDTSFDDLESYVIVLLYVVVEMCACFILCGTRVMRWFYSMW